MARDSWHLIREKDGAVTLARRVPARFDLAVEACLPEAARTRVAHRLRQDMWRALRDLRGFAPVVRIWREGGGLRVRAGGAVAGRFARAAAEARIAALFEDSARVARWTGSGR
jgi:putative heme degradation protein